jgi:HK97 family phage major capsid protein
MVYSNRLARGTDPSFVTGANEANALMPLDVSREIIKGSTVKSAVMSMFRIKRMGTKIQYMPVLSALPTAYFVNGDTGLKQTTKVSWELKNLVAEEIAVIVPIPINVLEDSSYDIWAEIKPLIEEAIAVTFDAAVIFGVNKPALWPNAIAAQAIAAGNTVTLGASAIDAADDVNNVMAAVEDDGYEVNGFWMQNNLKATFRGLRDNQDGLIYQPNNPGVETSAWKGMLWGEKSVTSMAGLFEGAQFTTAGAAITTNKVRLVGGDWNQGIVGVRDDIRYKMLEEATIFDADGNVIYNFAQQDMMGMRVTFRAGFQVPNPINRHNQNNATRYPFAVLRHSS